MKTIYTDVAEQVEREIGKFPKPEEVLVESNLLLSAKYPRKQSQELLEDFMARWYAKYDWCHKCRVRSRVWRDGRYVCSECGTPAPVDKSAFKVQMLINS